MGFLRSPIFVGRIRINEIRNEIQQKIINKKNKIKMTNREQAQMTMFAALKAELVASAAAFAGNQDYIDEVTLFNTNNGKNSDAATAAHADNSGFSADKLAAKKELTKMASNMSGKAYVKFTNLNKISLASQLHVEPTDYSTASDSQCAKLAQEAHKLMSDNIADLTPNTITAGMLTDLQGKIDTFTQKQGSSDTVHEVSPEMTRKFKDSFKPVMTNVDHLKLLTRDYESSNPKFYARLMASTVIPVINVHHTNVEVHATAKSTGKPVEGIEFSLTRANKSDITDYKGNAEIEHVKSGEDVLTGKMNGNTVYTAHVKIKRGTLNHYDVVIDSI